MPLSLYNTMTGKKEAFRPLAEGKAGIYVCGITAYDVCHVGHARSAVVFDTVVRYLRYSGYQVTYVKNFTDVDDKIIDRAKSEGTDIRTVAERYIREHDRSMDALGVERPDHAPRATEHIDGMIDLIGRLIDRSLAYVIGGDVYYAVEMNNQYGKLSGRSPEDMVAGARVEVDERKRNPLDFALWKGSKEGEPWWESPWGRGRPGWHIECSAMSQYFLGDTFDIHGGGEDLIFPHHENEIAQSEGATGKPLAQYWLHNGFVKINSEKMSKSLGNIFNIDDLLHAYHPEVLRLFLLQNHYRSPLDYSDKSLSEARQGMGRLYASLQAVMALDLSGNEKAPPPEDGGDDASAALRAQRERFCEAMDDDFNTARAIGCLFDMARFINGYVASKPGARGSLSRSVLRRAHEDMREAGAVLGLLRDDPEGYFRLDREREAGKLGLQTGEIERLIEERNRARREKNWAKADEIREELAKRRVVLKDMPGATTWEIA